MNKNQNIIGLIGFVLAITSIFSFGLTAIPGLIFSIIGLLEAKKYNNDKKDLSIAGIVISSFVTFVLLFAFSAYLTQSKDTKKNNTSSYSEKEEREEKEEKNDEKKSSEKSKIEVIDVSGMTKEDIQTWCDNNEIICSFTEEYSETVEQGNFISQSKTVGSEIEKNETLSVTYSKGKAPTFSQTNALNSAKSYLRSSSFSYSGLVEQLEYEKYSHEDAVWAVDRCGADWNEQAVKSAASYLKYDSFSHAGLVEQLEYEGFTHEQAEYGVSKNGL